MYSFHKLIGRIKTMRCGLLEFSPAGAREDLSYPRLQPLNHVVKLNVLFSLTSGVEAGWALVSCPDLMKKVDPYLLVSTDAPSSNSPRWVRSSTTKALWNVNIIEIAPLKRWVCGRKTEDASFLVQHCPWMRCHKKCHNHHVKWRCSGPALVWI